MLDIRQYIGSPKATDIISEIMLNLAGHCNKEEMTHNLIIWTTTRGKRRRCCQQFTFIEDLTLRLDLRTSMKYDL